MSRTDAHVPWWVRATWYEPSHSSHIYQPCNLPDVPVRSNPRRRPGYPHTGWLDCFWRPVHPSWRQVRRICGNTVPRWYVDHVWHDPERVRVRDGLTKICKQYNAGVRDDWDFPNHQARHGASWHWD